MVDEKGLAPEAADKIGAIVQWRGGTSTGPTVFEMSNKVGGFFCSFRVVSTFPGISFRFPFFFILT